MILTDTHAHLYLSEFDEDREQIVRKAIGKNVRYMLLPNINSDSVESMLNLCGMFPNNLFPMIGLHPTDVKENYVQELDLIIKWLDKKKFFAIGETGIDLYRDKTFVDEQKHAFGRQVELAKKYELPVVIHSRESFNEIFEVIENLYEKNLTGVFHCFTGTKEQAEKIIGWGFKLGIGGVLTFKNSGLDKVVADIPLKNIILETDSPFLAPNPYRGKRNESSYLIYIAQKLADIKKTSLTEIAGITTQNAIELFKFEPQK